MQALFNLINYEIPERGSYLRIIDCRRISPDKYIIPGFVSESSRISQDIIIYLEKSVLIRVRSGILTLS